MVFSSAASSKIAAAGGKAEKNLRCRIRDFSFSFNLKLLTFSPQANPSGAEIFNFTMGALSSFQNIFRVPELKNRIVFTLALLTVYRIEVIFRPRDKWRGVEQVPFRQRRGRLWGF